MQPATKVEDRCAQARCIGSPSSTCTAGWCQRAGFPVDMHVAALHAQDDYLMDFLDQPGSAIGLNVRLGGFVISLSHSLANLKLHDTATAYRSTSSQPPERNADVGMPSDRVFARLAGYDRCCPKVLAGTAGRSERTLLPTCSFS